MDSQTLRQWLSSAHAPGALYGAGGLLLLVAYLVWRVSLKIVRVGFFLVFTAVGFGLASAASLALNGRLAPPPILAASAIGFGFFVSAVRSKVMRVVGAATVLIVAHTLGSAWLQNQSAAKSLLGGVPAKQASRAP